MFFSHVMLPVVAAISLLAAPTPQASDEIRNVAPALRNHLRTEAFTPIATVGALPAGVRAALQELFGEKTLALAEPGSPFQSTDVVMGPPLPFRRMIAAGRSNDHCIVYYE